MGIEPAAILGGLAAGGAVACGLLAAGLKPAPRLAPRLRPYNSPNRVRLGRAPDLPARTASTSAGLIERVLGPPLKPVIQRISHLLGEDAHDQILHRLRQARLYQDLPGDDRLGAYRGSQIRTAALAVLALTGLGLARANGLLALLGVAAGTLFGVVWPHHRLQRAIAARRAQMRIDLPEVAHHLAVYLTRLRPPAALERLVGRAGGPVVAELGEVLAWMRAGQPITDALEEAARATPEPHAARLYRMLAKADQAGPQSNYPQALRALASEVRAGHRDQLQRRADGRQLATLIPRLLLILPFFVLILAPLAAFVAGMAT